MDQDDLQDSLLDQTQGFIPSTQPFGMADVNEDEDVTEEPMPSTQAFSPHQASQAFAPPEANPEEFQEDLPIGTQAFSPHRQEVLSQPFSPGTFEEADRIIDSQLRSFRDDSFDDLMPPPPAPPDFDTDSAEAPPATQAFEADKVPSTDYIASSSEDVDYFSATQSFDVGESSTLAEGQNEDGPRSPSPEQDGPRSPSPEKEDEDGPQSPDGDDEEKPPQSPADYDIGNKDDDEETGSNNESPKKHRRIILSSDEDSDADDENKKKKVDDDDGSDPGSPRDEGEAGKKEDEEVNEDEALIADIFGEGHDSDADEEGKKQGEGEDGNREGEGSGGREGGRDGNTEWDFDVMMRNKKRESSKRRRRRKDGSVDLQSDADEYIKELIGRMKEAAEEDRALNKEGKPALKKRMMLNLVRSQMLKTDYREALVDLGIISAIAEWLAPLPDKSLPSLEIRTHMLRLLQQFVIDHSILRRSGIGKAVMILYKHPKEVKKNREIAGKLIGDWARPIFELETDYRKLTKEDREKRDYEQLPTAKKQRLSMDSEEKNNQKEEERPLRPGDKGWIGRARVPQPSKKDYVVRPKSKIEATMSRKGGSKGTKSSSMDKKLKEYKDRIKNRSTMDHAVSVSIEGRNMKF